MKLKLIFISYPILQCCSYVIYKIIISVLFAFISFHIYVINFVTISLKRSIVPIYICPLTHVLILGISVVNTCIETIDRFRLSNNVYNKQYVCLLYKQCLIFRNLNSIKPFNNIIHIEFNGFYHFTNICPTVIFYSRCNFNTIKFSRLLRWLTWVHLIVVNLYNKLLDKTL